MSPEGSRRRPGSRRDNRDPQSRIGPRAAPEDPKTVGVNYRCNRTHLDGERVSVWKVRRDDAGEQAGVLYYLKSGLTPEHVDFAQYGGVRLECPVCPNVQVFTTATVHKHLDEARDTPDRSVISKWV